MNIGSDGKIRKGGEFGWPDIYATHLRDLQFRSFEAGHRGFEINFGV